MNQKHARLKWSTLAAAGAAGIVVGVGSVNLGWAQQLALAVTVGLTAAVVLQVVLHVVEGKRRGP